MTVIVKICLCSNTILTITIATCTNEISSLIKRFSIHGVHLILFLNYFPCVCVCGGGVKEKIKHYTETNFLRDIESSFMNSVDGCLRLWLGIFDNHYYCTSIPIPTWWNKSSIHGVSFMDFLCLFDWFDCTITHAAHLCNLQVFLCRFITK